MVDYFIKIYREVFELKAVSDNLYIWIDLIFGYVIYGRVVFIVKNVMVWDDEKSKFKLSGWFCIFYVLYLKWSVGEISRAVLVVNIEDDLCDVVEIIIKIIELLLWNV